VLPVTSFLDIALHGISRGWYVFPLKPKDKYPVISKAAGGKGFYDATLDAEQIKAWWTKYPTANVGIACGASDLYVADCDHGLNSEEDFHAWRMRNNLPVTYTVRTGRRTSYAVQMYFRGAMECNGKWELDGCSGEIRSAGGLVMSVGNIHPDTGESYQILVDAPLAPRPAIIQQAVQQAKVKRPTAPGEPLPMLGKGDGRHPLMMTKLGKAHQAGFSEQEAIGILMALNDERFSDPIPLDEIEQTVRSCYARWEPTETVPVVTIGRKPEENKLNWRERYLTFERVRDAKPVEFLIEGFLALDSITALAAPVGQRKSLIAMNIAHALCTGEPLFDYFKVVKQPSRVVYLCPEMGLSSFSMRLKNIGLDSHVGQTLFCQTMDEDSTKLPDLDEELPGAVVIIDTLTRFVDGDQNSSEDMSRFAKVVFGVKRRGATVLLLHHSIKGTANAPLTLDTAMRGSTELAAFVTCCWATRLTDPADPYKSPSLLVNVKQRDFESKPFEATSDKTCRMRIVGEPGPIAEINSKADEEAKTALASILKDRPKIGIKKLIAALKDAGYGKGQKWVSKERTAILGTGVRFGPS
jgi:hypothetical protein